MLKIIIQLFEFAIKKFKQFDKELEYWNNKSRNRYLSQEEINEAFFKARRDNLDRKRKILHISTPVIKDPLKEMFPVVTPNAKTRKYSLNKSENLTFLFNTQEEADRFSKNNVEPYFGKYSEFTNKFKEFTNVNLGEPFSITRELVIDKIMSDLERTCKTCENNFPVKADCRLCDRITLDRWAPKSKPHCPNCKASFNKANDGSVFVELYQIQGVTYE